MESHQTFISLPSDVLIEILKHLLLDTPRSPTRASVLRACSLLHGLGLPLLYRIVDLTGMRRRSTVTFHWKRLFGAGGLFVKGTRSWGGVSAGSFVRELRLGGGDAFEFDFEVNPLDLPLCSTLFFNLTQLRNHHCLPLKAILSQLPITELIVFYARSRVTWGDSFPLDAHGDPMNDLLGLDPQPWENLERIIFRGWIWYDHVYGGKRLSFSNLSFKVLVVEVPCGSPNARVEEVVGLFLDPVSKKDGRFLEEIERIEFRLVGEFTSDIEHKFRVEVKKRHPESAN
ncbi:hypothetical protein BDY24DRAFT_418416 [Mrakia frigida]|uniref:uncharacterized protein n=1 Tax=Mrakia frigida TaxID=29902 RepID=UPI003FCBF3AA